MAGRNGVLRRRSSGRYRTDELAAALASGEETTADLRISAATFYKSVRPMDTDAAKKLKELHKQIVRLKRGPAN